MGKTRISNSIRRAVIRRDGCVCAYCWVVLATREVTLDHVVAESASGVTSPANLVVACHSCNNRKGNLDLGQFIDQLRLSGNPMGVAIVELIRKRLAKPV